MSKKYLFLILASILFVAFLSGCNKDTEKIKEQIPESQQDVFEEVLIEDPDIIEKVAEQDKEVIHQIIEAKKELKAEEKAAKEKKDKKPKKDKPTPTEPVEPTEPPAEDNPFEDYFTQNPVLVVPVAVVTMNPSNQLLDTTEFSFSSEKSYDPKGYKIVNEEWINKKSTYPAGTHTVKLRVQNEYNLWSAWKEVTFTVSATPEEPTPAPIPEPVVELPIAVIDMNPNSELLDTTEISFSSEKSYDPNGHTISNEEWVNKLSTYPVGTHTVKLRVQSETGAWSEWTEVTFEVKQTPLPPVLEPVPTPEPVVELPVAVIDMNPSEQLLDTTEITFSSENSYDPNGFAITNEEWVNKQSTYTVGTHTVKLRVQNEQGTWSEWTEVTFEVQSTPEEPTPDPVPEPVVELPIAVITMNPSEGILDSTEVSFSSEKSYDPNGLVITNEEWENKQSTYTVGTHTVKLRVQNEEGTWSEWTEVTFEVAETPAPVIVPPIAVIDMNPSEQLLDSTEITFSSANSSDPNGLAITNEEWENKQSTYTAGTHTVKLRVQNEQGTWSEWVEVTFTVAETPAPPVAVITMNPSADLKPTTTITFSSTGSSDPKGLAITNEEWVNKKSTYPAGTHTVKLRVQNENGLWSEWVEKTFTVKEPAPAYKLGPITLISNQDQGYNFNYASWYYLGSVYNDIHNCDWSCRQNLYPPSAWKGDYYDYPVYVEEMQYGLKSSYGWNGREYYDESIIGNSIIKTFFNNLKLSSAPSGPILHSGFTAKGNLTDGSGTPIANQEVTLNFSGITKKATTDANGDYLFNVSESEIPRSSRTTYSYVSNHTTHWGQPTTVSVSAGGVTVRQSAIIRTHYLIGYAVYGNLFMQDIRPSSRNTTYYYNIKNFGISLP